MHCEHRPQWGCWLVISLVWAQLVVFAHNCECNVGSFRALDLGRDLGHAHAQDRAAVHVSNNVFCSQTSSRGRLILHGPDDDQVTIFIEIDEGPYAFEASLQLYAQAFGHFGRNDLKPPWEAMDKAELLKSLAQ